IPSSGPARGRAPAGDRSGCPSPGGRSAGTGPGPAGSRRAPRLLAAHDPPGVVADVPQVGVLRAPVGAQAVVVDAPDGVARGLPGEVGVFAAGGAAARWFAGVERVTGFHR